MAILFVISLHWGQFQALFGFGSETARFDLAGRRSHCRRPMWFPLWRSSLRSSSYLISKSFSVDCGPTVARWFRRKPGCIKAAELLATALPRMGCPILAAAGGNGLLGPDHHRVRSGQRLYTHSGKAGFLHPPFAIGTRVIEASRRLQQHIQAHH